MAAFCNVDMGVGEYAKAMTFSTLIKELSELLNVEIEDAGGAFALEIDGQTVILQLADGLSDDILLTRADLGEVPKDRLAALSATALSANYLYLGTGGSTLAASPNGHLHLHRYDWLNRLDAESTTEMLTCFANAAAEWKRIVSDISTMPETEQSADLTSSGQGFLQV